MKAKFLNTSFITIAIALAGCLLFFSTIGWNKNVLKGGDQWGYNTYLVASFINHDLATLDRSYEAKCKQYGIKPNPVTSKNRVEEAPDAPNGKRILKYYYGVAAMQAPFFLITHLFVQGNGYSEPYVFVLTLSSIFYVLIGIALLLNLLKNFVPGKTAAITSLLFFFGSNLFYFTVCNPGMAHPYLFFLFAALASCTFRFYKNPSYRSAVLLGLIGGLIVVTRAVELIVLIVPLFFGVSNLIQLKQRFGFIRFHFKKYMLAVIIFLLVLIPQLLYWKYVSGQWIYDSYPQEGFDFLHPKILQGFFSFKNGWFAYTPLMLFPLLCMFFFFKKRNPFAIGIALYLAAQVYITYSWTQWNYNAGLGSRPMVESYALLLLPFAVGFQSLIDRKLKWLFIFLISACVYINILRTIQMQTGHFISEDATWQFNKQMMFKNETALPDLYAFDLNQPQPDTSTLAFVKQLGVQDFENGSVHPRDSLHNFHTTVSGYYRDNEFNDAVSYNIGTGFHKGDYIKISAWARVSTYENHYRMSRIVIDLLRNGEHVFWANTRIHNKLANATNPPSLFHGAINQWVQMNFYVKIDHKILPGDQLKVYAWNPTHVEFWLDDLLVEQYRKR